MFAAPIIDRVGWMLIHSVWQFTAIAALAVLVERLLARQAAAWRYAIGCGALTAMVAAAMLTMCATPPAHTANRSSPSATPNITAAPAAIPADLARVGDLERPALPPATNTAEEPPASATPPRPAELGSTTLVQQISTRLAPWLPAIVVGWLCGASLLALRPLIGLYAVRRLRRVGRTAVAAPILNIVAQLSRQLGIRRSIEVAQTILLDVPAVVGNWRPLLLLPASALTGLAPRELEAIIAHELAHIRRLDYLVNFLQTLVETLFFYHPAVWWISHRVRQERENCCDDLALAICRDRTAYAQALVALEGLRGATPQLAVAANGGPLLQRIRRLLSAHEPQAAWSLGGWLGCACTALFLGVGVWVVATAEGAAQDQWGDPVNGLACRIVPVDTTLPDGDIDLERAVTKFAQLDDLTFAVELKNVSDRTISLAGVRYGDTFPGAKGNLNANHFAPHFFEFEFTTPDGQPVRRTPRQFHADSHAMIASGASIHALEPQQSLKVLLRPAQFERSMNYRLEPGAYRVKVRYRGLRDEVREFVRGHWPDRPILNTWSGEVASQAAPFSLAADPNAHRPHLVWGPVQDGLQAALEIRVPPGFNDPTKAPGVRHTTLLGAAFHVKNVSDQPITFVSETPRQGDSVHVTNAAGEKVEVRDVWFSGWPIDVRWQLQPGDVAILDVLTPSLSDLDQAGEYMVHYTIRFNSRSLKDDAGHVIFPAPGDYQSELDTGKTPLVLTAPPLDISAQGEIHGRVVEDDTGEPIRDALIKAQAVYHETGRGGSVEAKSDSAGWYRLQPRAPGIYNVWLAKHPRSSTATAVADDGILVQAGLVATSELRVLTGRFVSGTVIDEAGQPVPNRVVHCYSAARPTSSATQSIRTKYDGTFSFRVPPGRTIVYCVEELKPTEDNPLGQGRRAERLLDVPRTGEVEPLTLRLENPTTAFGSPEWLKRTTPGTQIERHTSAAQVKGLVSDADGMPLAGARVFRADDGTPIRTNDQGEFVLPADQGTQFVLHVFQPGYHLWLGTPTAGDELTIVLERKPDRQGEPAGRDEPAAVPAEPAQPAAPAPAPRAEPRGESPKPPVMFRGLNLSELPATTDDDGLPDLSIESPAGSGQYRWHPDTCFLPIPQADPPTSIFYRPGPQLYFVRRETDDQQTWFGPVAGNPLEQLQLEPLLLESMREFATAGNAGIALRRMARSSDPTLAATGLRLMRQMLTDSDTLRSIDERTRPRHQAEQNLDLVVRFLQDHGAALRGADIAGLAELEAAVAAMEARFVAAMPTALETAYSEAGYLQSKLPPDEALDWGPEHQGLRLGVALQTHDQPSQERGLMTAKLYLQNVSQMTQRFHLEGHRAEWVRTRVVDEQGQPVVTEEGDIATTAKTPDSAWRLAPAEKLELCTIHLTSALPDEVVPTTAIRSLLASTTRIRAGNGTYTGTFTVPLNFRRVLQAKGEWSGTLTSSPFTIQIAARDDVSDN